MDWNYDLEYRITKVVSAIFMSTIIVFTIIAELLIRSNSTLIVEQMFEDSILTIIRNVFYGLASLLLICGLTLKMRIRDPQDGVVLNLMKSLIRNMHNMNTSSAIGLLMVIPGLFEAIGVLGLVLCLFSGGVRMEFYPLLVTSLLAMIIALPKSVEKDNLIALDKEVSSQ